MRMEAKRQGADPENPDERFRLCYPDSTVTETMMLFSV
jgi:hypothetical protein